jgi:hypothetical protein
MKKNSANDRTHAARAEAAFRPITPKPRQLSEQALEQKAFDDNRERLKAERLAREALIKSK